MDKREKSGEFARVAARLIDQMPELEYIKNSCVRIAYLTSELEKKKGSRLVLGQCEKIPEKFQWKVPYDFMITVFSPNVERKSEKQLQTLIFHELLHVGIEVDGNEEKYYIRGHDYEEFGAIISRYGLDWSEDEQA